MVRLRAHRNESLGGLQWQYKTQDKNRLHSSNRSFFFGPEIWGYTNIRSPLSSTHRSVSPLFSPSWERKRIRFNGARSPVCFYIYYGASDHSSNLERDHARAMNELAGLETFVSFCFRFLMFVYQVKKQYSTANTVLLLPLTTKNSTLLLLPNQHKNKQQYNSIIIHDLKLTTVKQQYSTT